MPSSPVSSSSALKSEKKPVAAGQKAVHSSDATTVQGMTSPNSEALKTQVASGEDVQRVSPQSGEIRHLKSAGKLPDNRREMDMDTEKDHLLGMGDAVVDGEEDNMGRVIIGSDGITRVNVNFVVPYSLLILCSHTMISTRELQFFYPWNVQVVYKLRHAARE
jgi:hypothetical protein